MVQNVPEAKEELAKRMNFQKIIIKSKCDNIFFINFQLLYIFYYIEGDFVKLAV